MPTFEVLPQFAADLARLTPQQRQTFSRTVLGSFVPGLPTGAHGRFRPGLRVKRVGGSPGVYELTWSRDGRATWHYGRGRGHGPHVVWRRIGTHKILGRP